MDNSNEKLFTLEELSQYNGLAGRPAYVAVDGIVYDVTSKTIWAGGTHFFLTAGKDLTKDFHGCHPITLDILNSLTKVGRLV